MFTNVDELALHVLNVTLHRFKHFSIGFLDSSLISSSPRALNVSRTELLSSLLVLDLLTSSQPCSSSCLFEVPRSCHVAAAATGDIDVCASSELVALDACFSWRSSCACSSFIKIFETDLHSSMPFAAYHVPTRFLFSSFSISAITLILLSLLWRRSCDFTSAVLAAPVAHTSVHLVPIW